MREALDGEKEFARTSRRPGDRAWAAGRMEEMRRDIKVSEFKLEIT
jgi:hypothetical protein